MWPWLKVQGPWTIMDPLKDLLALLPRLWENQVYIDKTDTGLFRTSCPLTTPLPHSCIKGVSCNSTNRTLPHQVPSSLRQAAALSKALDSTTPGGNEVAKQCKRSNANAKTREEGMQVDIHERKWIRFFDFVFFGHSMFQLNSSNRKSMAPSLIAIKGAQQTAAEVEVCLRKHSSHSGKI